MYHMTLAMVCIYYNENRRGKSYFHAASYLGFSASNMTLLPYWSNGLDLLLRNLSIDNFFINRI